MARSSPTAGRRPPRSRLLDGDTRTRRVRATAVVPGEGPLGGHDGERSRPPGTDDVDAINRAARWIYPKYIGDDIDSWAPVFRSAVSDDPNESLIRISVGSTDLMS